MGSPRMIGRYALFDEIGHGGTATVHLGRLAGPAGFTRTVAIKRMHESVARDPEVAAMFVDEARLTGRIQHPNAVATFDVLALNGEAFLIMEYVHGESLALLLRTVRAGTGDAPAPIVVQILRDVLYGLHAAHEAKGEEGEPLDLVHRDVSPQNILVGVDGIARVLDFGIAKAVGRLQDTHTGQLKGKVSYMAPEQLLGNPIDRRADVFAAGIVLWEALAGRRLYDAESSGRVVYRVLREDAPLLTELVPGVPVRVAEAVARATARDPSQRFATALEFARALEHGTEPLPPRVVGDWVRTIGGATLAQRELRLKEIEATPLGAGAGASPADTADGDGANAREAGSAPSRRGASANDETTQSDSHIVEAPVDPEGSPRRGSLRRWFAAGVALGAVSLAGLLWSSARTEPGHASKAGEGDPVAQAATPLPSRVDVAPPASGAPPLLVTTATSIPESHAIAGPPPPSATPARNRPWKKAAPKTAPPRPAAAGPATTARRPEDLFSRE